MSGLIESDWNLKESGRVKVHGIGQGLIESDWNLKAIVRIQNPEASIRINRIRLEFKES